MLSGCWLLSDLDGTLISTPHKAHGKYPSITQSPCFHPIQRWLMNGGNVCIVTTADLRTMDQVYFPLRPCLAQTTLGDFQKGLQKGDNGNQIMHKASNSYAFDPSASSSDAYRSGKDLSSFSNKNNEKPEPLIQGSLFLSLYSGAALYRCSTNSVELVKDYVNSTHCTVYNSTDLVKPFKAPQVPPQLESKTGNVGGNASPDTVNYVQGTCISRGVSEKLLAYLTKLYERYISDLLRGEPVVVAASLQLSRRYQMMWRAIFCYLDDVYQCVHENRCTEKLASYSRKDFSDFLSAMQKDEEAVSWKMSYFRSRPDLLICLGMLRIECIKDKAFSGVSPASSGQCKLQEDEDRMLLVENVKSLLLKDLPLDVAGSMDSRAKAFASHMIHALGVDPGCLRKRSNESDSTLVDVAQLIVLGIPLGLFSRYFVKSMPEFARIGVNIMPQPNSVVFSKLGINKSTVVQYLLGENWNPNRPLAQTAGAGDSLLRRSPSGLPPVCSSKVIALGDNPHTTDYGLTVFRNVRFISFERMPQREERYRRIERRLGRTRVLEQLGEKPRMPDGTPAPSYKELLAALTRCGALMDDRLCKNISYVGNEEDGAAVFLTFFMDELKVPPFTASTNWNSNSSAVLVDSKTFTEALSKAVKLASSQGRPEVMNSNL